MWWVHAPTTYGGPPQPKLVPSRVLQIGPSSVVSTSTLISEGPPQPKLMPSWVLPNGQSSRVVVSAPMSDEPLQPKPVPYWVLRNRQPPIVGTCPPHAKVLMLSWCFLMFYETHNRLCWTHAPTTTTIVNFKIMVPKMNSCTQSP